ncbi:MAG: hypothetical protein J5777_05005 [Clostridiales bacterium]|nr:hypothetical protein [Clostridiales bacterium]
MTGMIKEEILTTVRKKRFIILTALLFAGAIVVTVKTKNYHWNDMTYYLKMQQFIDSVFDAAIGPIVLFSIWRRKYTRTSILQAEAKGVKRGTAVISRALAGSIILICCYALMALFAIVLGFVFSAGLSSSQMTELVIKTGVDCIAAVASFCGCLFWLYLFAFPLVPMVLDFLIMVVVADTFASLTQSPQTVYFVYMSVFPKCAMDVFYTSIIFGRPQYQCVLFCLVNAVVTLLLTILVFKLKKKDKKKKAKKGKGEIKEAADAVSAAVSSDPEIAQILKESELTEEIIE